jgi:maltose alpha-D-glucosyltransferase/alpha-amylase
LLAALPGPVMVYYGEEIGMLGQKGTSPYWDNYRREPMDWLAGEEGPFQTTWFKVEDRWNAPDDGISVEEQENDPGSLLNFYRTLFQLRGTLPALSQGEIAFPDISGSSLAWGFVRYTDEQTIVALFNFGDEPAALTIWDFPFTSGTALDLLSGEFYANADGAVYEITLPPAGVVWLSGE